MLKIIFFLSIFSIGYTANVFEDTIDISSSDSIASKNIDWDLSNVKRTRGASFKVPEYIDLNFLDDLDELQKDPILQGAIFQDEQQIQDSNSLKETQKVSRKIQNDLKQDSPTNTRKQDRGHKLKKSRYLKDTFRNNLRSLIAKVLGEKLQVRLKSDSNVCIPWTMMAGGDILNWPENVPFKKLPELKVWELDQIAKKLDKLDFSADFLSRLKGMKLNREPRRSYKIKN